MMKVNISSIIGKIGASEEFFFEVPSPIVDLQANLKVVGDVLIKGTVINTGTCYRLEGEITCRLSGVCDRCLSDFQTTGNYSFTEEFTQDQSLAESESMNYFADDSIILDKLVQDIIISSQSASNLCDDNCRGLCCKCGANLNNTDCGCDTRSIDPRLAILQDLVK